jgi:hypothetical protein
MTPGGAIYFVCQQAIARLPELAHRERVKVLAGLRLMLPTSEFEQCCILHESLTAREDAQRRAEEAQLILGDMLNENRISRPIIA